MFIFRFWHVYYRNKLGNLLSLTFNWLHRGTHSGFAIHGVAIPVVGRIRRSKFLLQHHVILDNRIILSLQFSVSAPFSERCSLYRYRLEPEGAEILTIRSRDGRRSFEFQQKVCLVSCFNYSLVSPIPHTEPKFWEYGAF